ncbi:hypothetical protein CRM22_000518 [Opisthorchis felineus]|uniref:cyclin-dependent kinase n=1 Tax=Opisthorchis felineus TaxID=147828 RepID=A0A4S2MKV4_OPIFE|nr:hypothetical protein CRM22_000518 [Opisthorchis felineus]
MERYENLGLVGEGSYGMVMKCKDRGTGQIVAIKKFIDTEDDKLVKKIAAREIKMLKQLRHDNLVNLLDIFRRKRRLYLVFEFVDHTVLDDLEQHPKGLDEERTRRILFQVLRGVEFCHTHNVIHRDIKPENVLISKRGVVKLCDFGFARALAAPGEVYTDYVATRWYRAPELLVGDSKYGRAVDIWAVGCLAAEMLTGNPLFPGDSDIDQLYHIVRCLGNLSEKHQLVFKRNPLFSGMRIPAVRDVVPLERRLNKVRKSTLEFIKECLRLDANDRANASALLRSNYFTRDNFSTFFTEELKRLVQYENLTNDWTQSPKATNGGDQPQTSLTSTSGNLLPIFDTGSQARDPKVHNNSNPIPHCSFTKCNLPPDSDEETTPRPNENQPQELAVHTSSGQSSVTLTYPSTSQSQPHHCSLTTLKSASLDTTTWRGSEHSISSSQTTPAQPSCPSIENHKTSPSRISMRLRTMPTIFELQELYQKSSSRSKVLTRAESMPDTGPATDNTSVEGRKVSFYKSTRELPTVPHTKWSPRCLSVPESLPSFDGTLPPRSVGSSVFGSDVPPTKTSNLQSMEHIPDRVPLPHLLQYSQNIVQNMLPPGSFYQLTQVSQQPTLSTVSRVEEKSLTTSTLSCFGARDDPRQVAYERRLHNAKQPGTTSYMTHNTMQLQTLPSGNSNARKLQPVSLHKKPTFTLQFPVNVGYCTSQPLSSTNHESLLGTTPQARSTFTGIPHSIPTAERRRPGFVEYTSTFSSFSLQGPVATDSSAAVTAGDKSALTSCSPLQHTSTKQGHVNKYDLYGSGSQWFGSTANPVHTLNTSVRSTSNANPVFGARQPKEPSHFYRIPERFRTATLHRR